MSFVLTGFVQVRGNKMSRRNKDNPTLGTISKITFDGLRNSIGESGGVLFDNDARITYLCRVVRVPDGLKWQIIKNKYQSSAGLIEHDQECLDQHGIDDVEIVHVPMVKYSINKVRGKISGDSINFDDWPF